MPTIPKTVKMNASSIDILNAIRAEASYAYQERIPEATRDNIREIGNAMLDYQPVANEFLSALVNRIARVIITSKLYENPLKEFKKGLMEYGEAVEEVFVAIAKAHRYDPAVAEKEFMKREIPDVQAVFHRLNYQNFYKVTIQENDLRLAFLSVNGVTDLIAKIVDTLYTGAEYDEFVIMKQLIADGAKDGKFYPVNVPEITAANAKEIVSIIKAQSNALEFMSNNYNAMGVLTHSRKDEQILLIDAKFDAVIDVEVLASAFNMDKAEFMGRRVLVDNFGDLTGVVAALVDRSWFMVFDNMIRFTEDYNGEGLYWNYWLHVWKTFSTSPFSNAILFTTETPKVTGVTVTPSTAAVTKGQTLRLAAEVSATGYAPKDVVWSVEGNGETPVSSTVNYKGELLVGLNEENTELTVTATSVFDGAVSGTATITVA